MKTRDLVPGMLVAVKAGPSSKQPYRAMVVDPAYVGRFLQGTRDSRGVAVARSTKVLRGDPLGDGCRLDDFYYYWEPEMTTPAMVVGPWEEHEALEKKEQEAAKAERMARHAAEAAKEARSEALQKKGEALSIRSIGFLNPQGRVLIGCSDLDRLLDLAEIGQRLVLAGGTTVDAEFACCGGNDEHPPVHNRDCGRVP